MRSRLLTALPLALAALLCSSTPARPQAAESDDDAPIVWAGVQVRPGQLTTLSLMGRTRDPLVTEALARMAGRPPQSSEYGGDWTRWNISLPGPTRRGLAFRQELRLDPLLEVLHAQGEPSLSLLIQHPAAGFVSFTGARAIPVQRGALSASVATSPSTEPLSLDFGWRPSDVARVTLLLLLALLMPIVAALAIDLRSIARDRVPERWFFRAQAIQLVSIGGWVLWMVVVEASRAADLTELAFRWWSGSRAFTAPLWMLGFFPTALVLAVITRRMVRRLRGFDPLPAAHLASLRAMALLLLLVIACAGFVAGNLRLGVLTMLTAIGAAVLWPARGPLGTTPQSLSSGALRDRLFDLAHRAGVKLRELYVVPMRRQRMANAFAVHGGMVMVADELLDRMSRREVDAVLAHEISHLEHFHPIKTLLAALGAYAVFASSAAVLRLPYGFAAALVALWLMQRFVARRFEFAADAGAAALTSDPEALISGLGRLGRFNEMPLSWGRGWRWLITHPTTEARGQAIGRRAGLAPERVTALLRTGLDSDERYGDRERPGEQERVFSSLWKTATMGRLGLAILATAVAAPATALALGRGFAVPAPHLLVIVAGAALALLAILFLQDHLAARVVSRLEPKLRQRLAERSGDPLGEMERFVALSPGDRARVYEGFFDWDIGLLAIGPDEIRYRGEQVTLRLPRTAVRAVEVGASGPTWIKAPRVIVRWLGPSGEEAISLRAADCRTVSAIAPASRALAEQLERWRQVSAATPGHGTAPAGVGPVTARTPRDAAAPRDLPLVLVLLGTISAAASFALGFDYWHGLDVFAAALIGIMAMRWPMMTSRETSSPKAGARESERRAA